MKKAVCLLSGGLDSAATAYIAKKQGYSIYALTFDYNQRHRREVQHAKDIARKLGAVEHKIIQLDLASIGGSALTSRRIKVPKTGSKGIPATYVPARNTIFLSIALAYAEVVGADSIFIGANHIDYSGYPDCRPEYFKAFQKMTNLATKRGVEGHKIKIKTPIIKMSKADIVKKAVALKVPLEQTWSCYKGGKKACGRCDSCTLRKHGFKQAGIKDPAEYET